MIIKFITLKIAPGHNLRKNRENNGIDNPFIDRSGTNLSSLSKPVHFPVYNMKMITLERHSHNYRIIVTKHSEYSNKIYFVMLLKAISNGSAIITSNKDEFPNLTVFK